jgi:NAD(P)H-dependent nitrite reductase small subunit
VVHDTLGINADLEAQMQYIVDTYHDEWAEVVKSEPRRRRFRQFVNSPETQKTIEFVEERGQWRPADWEKNIEWTIPEGASDLGDETWVDVGSVADFPLKTGTPVLYGKVQLAVFRYQTSSGASHWYASQNMCPHKRAFVLSEGLLGSVEGDLAPIHKVACPLHKKNFALASGDCVDDPSLKILTFPVRVTTLRDDSSTDDQGRVELFLPPQAKLDAILATDGTIVRSSCSGGGGTASGSAAAMEIKELQLASNNTAVSA